VDLHAPVTLFAGPFGVKNETTGASEADSGHTVGINTITCEQRLPDCVGTGKRKAERPASGTKIS